MSCELMTDATPAHNLVERDSVIERLTSTKCAVIADHAGLNGITAFELDNAGDDAGMGKVYLFNSMMRFGQHLRLM
jgi:hypothetical protein